MGAYDCQSPRRGDVVAYSYGGRILIKMLRGLPGDRFSVERTAQGNQLRINGRVARNSRRKPYLWKAGETRLLELYAKQSGGVIPADAYLLLGNKAQGSLDCTRFGLVSKAALIGRVILPSREVP